jgi:hypothetical protein
MTMNYDFSEIAEGESFVSVPAGTHLCRVAEVRKGEARDGNERWSMRLEVCEGDYAGRTAAWDSITWSPRGIHRVRRVLGALGFDVSGSVELEADDLVGLTALIQTLIEEWEDPTTGYTQTRCRVPYQGFGAAPSENGAGGAGT